MKTNQTILCSMGGKTALFLSVATICLFACAEDAMGQITAEITELNLNSGNNYNMKWGVDKRVIVAPQWVKDTTSEPVFYPMTSAINVCPKFELSEPWGSVAGTARVCATDTISGITVPQSSTPIPAYATEFSIETQTIAHADQLTDSMIGGETLNFNWKYSFDGGYTWEDAGTTSNFCYVTFAAPTAPWSTNGYDGIPVYVEMMDYACSAMSGATDEFSAIQKLTMATAGFMIYDGSMHYTGEYYVDDFYVREFVEDCNGYISGPAEKNDCRDFACVADTLGAAIGISDNIQIYAFWRDNGEPYHDFPTLPIKPAGMGDVVSVTWEFHQLNYRKPASTKMMSDGSLLLDSDNNEFWTSPGILANYDIDWDDYEFKLVRYLYRYPTADQEDIPYCVINEGVRPWAP